MLLESLYNYWAVIVLMMVGLYTVVAQGNLIKKIIGLNIFQTSVFIFYISVGKVEGGSAPILDDAETLYSNPLPHVLILTAIVVGIATTALALALVLRIKHAYGSVEELDIQELGTQKRTPNPDAKALMPGEVCGTVSERDLADEPTGTYSRRVPQTSTGSSAARGSLTGNRGRD